MTPIRINPLLPPRRSKRRRFKTLALTVFYLSSLIPAAILAFKFDSIRQFLSRLIPAPTSQASSLPTAFPPQNDSPQAPSFQRPRAPAPPQDQIPNAEQSTPVEPRIVALDAGRLPAAPDPPTNAISVRVTLSEDRHYVWVDEVSHESKCRIIDVQNCNTVYRMVPADGSFSIGKAARIQLDAERPVEIRVSIEENLKNGTAIVVEPLVELDSGALAPFTSEELTEIRDRIIRAGNQKSKNLARLEAEANEIATWIASPIIKPLAAVGEAKNRLIRLQGPIAELHDTIAGIEDDLALTYRMTEFAESLGAACSIVIEGDTIDAASSRPRRTEDEQDSLPPAMRPVANKHETAQ